MIFAELTVSQRVKVTLIFAVILALDVLLFSLLHSLMIRGRSGNKRYHFTLNLLTHYFVKR